MMRPAILLAAAVALSPIRFFAGEASLPDRVDLRPAFANRGVALRLQGGRGTCSVFTMTGAIEFALAGGRPHVPLSVEFLNWAANEATHEAEDGSFFSDLWTGFSAYGVCLETNMPYEAKFDTNRRPSEIALQQAREPLKAGLRFHWIKPWDVKTGLTDEHFTQIKATLAKQWPVCGGFRWPKEERWKDGVLEMRPPEGVFDGHSVLLVGYRDDARQPGGGVFLIRNSGKGDHDAAMSYEYVRAYMNDAAWVELPDAATARRQPASE
ncbi:MAG TPA: C1 family peptidase [Verrucomicrobiae bacterium]